MMPPFEMPRRRHIAIPRRYDTMPPPRRERHDFHYCRRSLIAILFSFHAIDDDDTTPLYFPMTLSLPAYFSLFGWLERASPPHDAFRREWLFDMSDIAECRLRCLFAVAAADAIIFDALSRFSFAYAAAADAFSFHYWYILLRRQRYAIIDAAMPLISELIHFSMPMMSRRHDGCRDTLHTRWNYYQRHAMMRYFLLAAWYCRCRRWWLSFHEPLLKRWCRLIFIFITPFTTEILLSRHAIRRHCRYLCHFRQHSHAADRRLARARYAPPRAYMPTGFHIIDDARCPLRYATPVIYGRSRFLMVRTAFYHLRDTPHSPRRFSSPNAAAAAACLHHVLKMPPHRSLHFLRERVYSFAATILRRRRLFDATKDASTPYVASTPFRERRCALRRVSAFRDHFLSSSPSFSRHAAAGFSPGRFITFLFTPPTSRRYAAIIDYAGHEKVEDIFFFCIGVLFTFIVADEHFWWFSPPSFNTVYII